MRIRKPFSAVQSRTPWEMAGGFPCIGDGDNDEDAKEEFLRPLVEAVLDVQTKAKSNSAEDATPTPSPAPEIPVIAAVHRRPAHNWRNGLLGPDADSKEIKVGREGDKSNCGNEIIRNRGGKIQRHASQGIKIEAQAACVRKATSSSAKQEISDIDSKCEVPKSGRIDIRAQDLDAEKSKKRRSILGLVTKYSVDEHIDAGGNCATMISSKETLFENDNLKKKNKAQDKNKKSSNHHGGSQCTRRNGRGWRCSQRTLVGYSLCEHHLGNARFKSVSGDGPVAANRKGIKLKELHLIRAASSKVEPER